MKKLLLGCIAVLLVLACGLGFYYVFKSDEGLDEYQNFNDTSSQNSESFDNKNEAYNSTFSDNVYQEQSVQSSNEAKEIQKTEENKQTKPVLKPAVKPVVQPSAKPASNPSPKQGSNPFKTKINSKAKHELSKTLNKTSLKGTNPLKATGFSCNNLSSLIKEYQCKGKDSTYIPSLSDHFLHVYFENGILPSKYRLKLLKSLFASIKSKSKDYNLTIFVKMLPNLSMDFSIYNKDIIFANKAVYKYVYKDIPMNFKVVFAPHEKGSFKGEAKLVKYTKAFKRDEVIKRVFIGTYTDARGSNFANYLLGLHRATSVASYFFPLAEAVYMHSFGKSKEARKVEIQLLNK